MSIRKSFLNVKSHANYVKMRLLNSKHYKKFSMNPRLQLIFSITNDIEYCNVDGDGDNEIDTSAEVD